MTIVQVGIDLTKQVFSVNAVDKVSKTIVMKPNGTTKELLIVIAALSRCVIDMKMCSGARFRARQFERFVTTVRLMAPKPVAPYRISGKCGNNGAADAAGICEAINRPSMRLVPIRSELRIWRVMAGMS